jgi:hypothetical protein
MRKVRPPAHQAAISAGLSERFDICTSAWSAAYGQGGRHVTPRSCAWVHVRKLPTPEASSCSDHGRALWVKP